MQDGVQKEPIDLDELVNSLIKRKSDTVSHETVAESEPPVSKQCEPAQSVPAVAEEVPTQQKEDLPEPTVVETTEKEPENKSEKKKKRFGLFRRKQAQEEEFFEDEWADWGLKPIGHYHTNETTDNPAAVKTQQASAEEAPAQPAPEKDDRIEEPREISSGREMPPVEPQAQTEISPEQEEPVETVQSDTAQEAQAQSVTAVEPATVIMPAVRPDASVVQDATRVVDIGSNGPGADLAEESHEQLPDQLSLEELVRVEDVDDTPAQESEEDPAQRLQRARLEKVKDFVLDGEEEEENEPEEEPEEEIEEEPEIEDFTGYDTTKAVQLEVQYRWRTSLIGLLLTAGLEIVLVLLTLITLTVGQSPITAIGYLTAHVFCLILMTVLNYGAVSRGLSGLFMLKANNDTAPAVATVVALCGVILHFINLDIPLPVFAPLAGLLMTLNAAGQCVKLARVRHNFSFVSYPGVKYTAATIEDEKKLLEIGRRVSMEEEIDVAYFHRTAFLSGYLGNAYDEDGGDTYANFGAPIAIAVSLAASLALLALGYVEGFWSWLNTFVFMLCLSAFSTSLSMQLPMLQSCKRMLRKGGFLVGWKAVDTYAHPDALVVDVADLYPDESMLLHGIKTFSGMHIDDAILDAASLSIRAGGPLSMIFRRIIQNKEELLHEVDSLVYEQGMGLAGWVDGRRVLVGNRRLLQNHGVDVPSSDYEARYAKNGRRLVYLSTAGELSAMFVVSYLPDATIGDALHELCRSRVTLLVRSNDPNITATDLCNDFGLDEYYVDVLPAVAGRMYDQLVSEETEQNPAIMASNGHILGCAMVLAACRSLQVKSRIVLVVRILMSVLGLLLCVPWALKAVDSYFLPAFGFMIAATLLTWLIPLFKRA